MDSPSPPVINGAAKLRHRLDYLAAFVVLLCASYVAVLVWVDHGNGTFSRLGDVWHLMLLAIVPVSLTYLFRYWRWQWLLGRKGHHVPVGLGLAGYLAGFALTATPGKAGELMRIRYFARMGIPAERTLGVFVFERASDLLVILSLSLLATSVFPTLGALAALVLGFVCVLFGAAAWPALLDNLAGLTARLPGRWLRRLAHFCLAAALELRSCLDLPAFGQSMLAGVIAWGLTSAVFVSLCVGMGLRLDPIVAFGIYPLAMLIGALSFVPGGVGTTELAIVLMLNRLGASTADAIAVAVAARLVTLWYAILVGAVSVLAAEFAIRKSAR
ncbi:lysylphosphatidylglycerol synthase transmembrane domain-containing protein [Xanthomonas vasicola]|uniref:lysylphosphatidylglycerol synthase transmembrane domain-containing protein n=1 Tax=Xanthomonas vasicola TaxID=56459 RepID=UPI000378199C|nr:lysylphosphatidylglycerol synthase transmembrane domain-containing protein [Xanthomonas vasicola]AZR36139.1 flippase-like domain-containing protein [Xanthomonas vasicola]KEZ99078.1 membrane protein [Xanthomonas vasicola pv. vasculorum NCPPB 895]KFA37562.1 membrane protein [Xanthomonas vasicola pv. vasculorum NCPPB 206]KGR54859.1 membrane protein [Xanthomonas vasicola]KGR57912.1 membrane protein [Xanthomonas vasicola]